LYPAAAEPDCSPHKWHPAGAVVDSSPKNGILLQQRPKSDMKNPSCCSSRPKVTAKCHPASAVID
jgi:hypothetical protein